MLNKIKLLKQKLLDLQNQNFVDNADYEGWQIKETIEKGLPPVFISVDVQEALDYLGEIIVETTPEEVLNYIFSQFCIGE